jgi:hypothetical protein
MGTCTRRHCRGSTAKCNLQIFSVTNLHQLSVQPGALTPLCGIEKHTKKECQVSVRTSSKIVHKRRCTVDGTQLGKDDKDGGTTHLKEGKPHVAFVDDENPHGQNTGALRGLKRRELPILGHRLTPAGVNVQPCIRRECHATRRGQS